MEESVFYIHEVGTKIWYLPSKGKDYWHRLDGPAIEGAEGTKHWYVDDKLHRLDGPAVAYADGEKEWWVGDKRHRLDGPAIEADRKKEWWVDGEELPTKDVEIWLEENNVDLSTEEGQMALKLRWM